jgi:hypothetical protein
MNGNCGMEGTEIESFNSSKLKYLACANEDAMCGLLHCQLGSETPLIKSEAYLRASTTFKSSNYECKVITDMPSMSYVSDGTVCESKNNRIEKVCLNRRCVSLQKIFNPSDIKNKCSKSNQSGSNNNRPLCSNNGICDNKQTCSCFPGWSGQYCDVQRKSDPGVVTLINNHHMLASTVPSRQNNTARPLVKHVEMTTTIVGFSLALLFILLISLIFCK